ncbi:hypothetical protein OCV73_05550 [Barnesiella propionica]|uniref:hypothetical protein n=1 Tax=Barnesiella propionica TaxID=2981781 RepID=UPI0011CC9C55|nr:hypothetical protein [Barnesiella propionica]MCU6768410.1 hypothetical protein [Barnesiella propionica]
MGFQRTVELGICTRFDRICFFYDFITAGEKWKNHRRLYLCVLLWKAIDQGSVKMLSRKGNKAVLRIGNCNQDRRTIKSYRIALLNDTMMYFMCRRRNCIGCRTVSCWFVHKGGDEVRLFEW